MIFELTQEQKDAVELSHQVKKLKLNAASGSSKTTTCTLIAEANPCPSLYLAFNKTMADDAQGRFPSWVEVRTTHSLAYKTFGRKYAHKLVRPAGDYQNVGWTGSEVARLLHIPSLLIKSTMESVTSNSIGSCVLATVTNFEHSADRVLEKKHVSLAAIPEKKQARFDFPAKKLRAEILTSAKKLWDKRVDLMSPVLISHDTYLKLYQLSNPDLSAYEIIYLDEYQDTNACVHAIATAQTKSSLVAVGDVFQAIYGWRGATNMMDQLDWPTTQLTKSFRFSQSVADIANEVLRENKTGDYRTKIVGFEKADTKVLSRQEWYNLEDKPTPITKIYRTNSNLIADAIEDIVAGKKVAIQIDVKNFVKCLESGLALLAGEKAKVKHDMFLGFDNWKEFTEEAQNNQECQKLLRLITSGEVGKILSTLRVYKVPKDFEVKYSTAHKMKGLEDDVIVLADDFPSAFDKNNNWVGLLQEEQNLLYVALTRAKKMLVKNTTLEEILVHWKDPEDVAFEDDDHWQNEPMEFEGLPN